MDKIVPLGISRQSSTLQMTLETGGMLLLQTAPQHGRHLPQPLGKPQVSHPAGRPYLESILPVTLCWLLAGGDGVSDWQWHSTQGAAPHRKILQGAEYALSFHVCFQGRVECLTVTQPGVPCACYASGCSATGGAGGNADSPCHQESNENAIRDPMVQVQHTAPEFLLHWSSVCQW